jgi:thiamine pyrophosphate-dependent acetolactate synthase large subunit-like protein
MVKSLFKSQKQIDEEKAELAKKVNVQAETVETVKAVVEAVPVEVKEEEKEVEFDTLLDKVAFGVSKERDGSYSVIKILKEYLMTGRSYW